MSVDSLHGNTMAFHLQCSGLQCHSKRQCHSEQDYLMDKIPALSQLTYGVMLYHNFVLL